MPPDISLVDKGLSASDRKTDLCGSRPDISLDKGSQPLSSFVYAPAFHFEENA